MLLIHTANSCLFKFRVITDTCVCIDISSIIRKPAFYIQEDLDTAQMSGSSAYILQLIQIVLYRECQI